MSDQPSPVLLRYKRKQIPSTGIVIAVLVALLLLFLWLHFILAQQIESAGREIQLKTEELNKIERHNHELRREISIAASQQRMVERSERLGYEPQQPVYLLVDHPLPPSSEYSQLSGLEFSSIMAGSARAEPGPEAAPSGLEDGQITDRSNGQ